MHWNGNLSSVAILHCQTKQRNEACPDLNHTKIEYSGHNASADVVMVKDQDRSRYVHVFARMCTKGGCVDSNKATVDPNFDGKCRSRKRLRTEGLSWGYFNNFCLGRHHCCCYSYLDHPSQQMLLGRMRRYFSLGSHSL